MSDLAVLWSLPVLFYVIGLVTRVLLPWLVKIVNQLRADEKQSVKWEWRYLAGQALVAVIVLLATPLLVNDPSTITEAAPFAAWSIGFAVADVGRELDKLFTGG